MRLSTAIEQFITYLRANRRSEATIDCYRRDLLRLVDHSGDLDVGALTTATVQDYVVSDGVQRLKDGRPRSDVGINRTMAALRSFGRWLERNGHVDGSPAATLEIRRVSRQSPSTLSEPERKRMLREVGARKGSAAARDRVMLELLLGTGIRLSELAGLDVTDVDIDGKRITIHAKGGNTETRFINANLRRRLRRYLRERNQVLADTPALFLSNRETRISRRQVQARFQLWLQWAGIKREGLSVHSLRHTFGSRLYRKTRDLVLVGRAMGHKTVEATLIYVHQDDEDLEDALESL
jgi:integrase/recombinase XerC